MTEGQRKLKDACDRAGRGSAASVAEICGVTPAAISQLLSDDGRVPGGRIVAALQLFMLGGQQVRIDPADWVPEKVAESAKPDAA